MILLAGALTVLLGSEQGRVDGWRVALVVAAVAGSQVLTGALNDWVDRDRDAATGQAKPIPAGEVSPAGALRVAAVGGLLQLAVSVSLGTAFTLLGLVAVASAVAYDLWLSRTPASVVPYLVAFGTLPLWVATGMGVAPERVLPAVPLAAAFAAAAHLANTLRDWELDAAGGSRSLAQVLGRRASRLVAGGLSLGVGIGVGAALLAGGRVTGPVAVAGLVGLAAVALGTRREAWLWRAQLVAAVAWTIAWALSTRA